MGEIGPEWQLLHVIQRPALKATDPFDPSRQQTEAARKAMTNQRKANPEVATMVVASKAAHNKFNLIDLLGRKWPAVSCIDPSLAGMLKAGDAVMVRFDRTKNNIPYIRDTAAYSTTFTTTDAPPEPPVPVLINASVWLQASGNVQKTLAGYNNLDFPVIGLPTLEDWDTLFQTQGSTRLANREYMFPGLLVVEEVYSDLPADDVNKKLVTLLEFTHNLNGGNIESHLYVYSLKARTDLPPGNNRILLDNVLSDDGGPIGMPRKAWDLPINLSGLAKVVLPYVSNCYARSYNNTMAYELDGDGNQTEDLTDPYDKIHVTFMAPTILQIDGYAPPPPVDIDVTIVETFTFELDGEEHSVSLGNTVVDVIEVRAGDDEDFGVYFDSYEIVGAHNDVLRVVTLDIPDTTISMTIEYSYKYEYFPMFEINLNRLSGQMYNQVSNLSPVRVNAVSQAAEGGLPARYVWTGNMGNAHCSIAMNVFCQAHIAGEKIHFARRVKALESIQFNWMRFNTEYVPAWNALIPELDSDTPTHRGAHEFFLHAITHNNSPAKIKDANIYKRRPKDNHEGTLIPPDEEDSSNGWVIPYYSLWEELKGIVDDNIGGTFRSILWLLNCQMKDNGSFSHTVNKLLERENPVPDDIISLTSIDDAIKDVMISNLEGSFFVTYDVMNVSERTYTTLCPEVVACEGFGPNVSGCTDPCFGPSQCDTPPEASGCFCFNYISDYRTVLLGTDYLIYRWGGYLEGDSTVTDVFGAVKPPGASPHPNLRGIRNVIVPLPLAYPNLVAPNLQRCSWTARSFGTPVGGTGGRNNVDPRVAVSPVDGAVYMVIIEGKFIYIPSGTDFTILSNNTGGSGFPPPPDEYPTPEQIICGWDWVCYEYSFIVTSCSDCLEGPYAPGSGGYFQDGPFTCDNYRRLPGSLGIGDTYTEYTSYGQKQLIEIRETKLLITNKAGTSTLTVPVCASFSGVAVNIGFLGAHIATEELSCPENCWDLVVHEGVVILLIDSRDEFNFSPRPIIQVHDRFSGAKYSEYRTLVPNEIYEDRYPATNNGDIHSEATRWNMWGRRVNEQYPGPRFKLAQKLNEEGVPTGPAYLHVSVDIHEEPNPLGDVGDIVLRREYRILKIEDGVVEEMRSISESVTVEDASVFVIDSMYLDWPGTYPSPGALGAMALTEGEAFLPAIKYEAGDFDSWQLISHQVTP